MKVATIERTFQYNGLTLNDLGGEFTTEQVMNHYAGIYPELTNAKIHNKGVNSNNKLVYEFKVVVGTKG